jgi:hypothetical protein
MRTATGGTPYAIGISSSWGFHVRVIRFGKLVASYERRNGEEIRRVELIVSEKKAKPEKVTV